MKRLIMVVVLGTIFTFVGYSFGSVIQDDIYDLNYMKMISKFRSGAGHDYSYDGSLISAGFYELETDPTENNRSMKHYFNVYDQYLGNNTTVPIYSPFDGTIYRVSDEGHDSGFINKQVWIQSSDNPNYYAIIHHVNLADTFPQIWNDYPEDLWPLHEPDDADYDRISVVSGETIGFGDFRSTVCSDVAILKKISDTEFHYLSYFASDLLPVSEFAGYQTRGVLDREDLIISKEFRDANPVDWWGTYNPDDWVELDSVPLPGTVWFLGSGLLGFSAFRKKVKKA